MSEAEREIKRLRRFIFVVEGPTPEDVAESWLAGEELYYQTQFRMRDSAKVRLTSVIQRARQDGAAASKALVEQLEAECARLRAGGVA